MISSCCDSMALEMASVVLLLLAITKSVQSQGYEALPGTSEISSESLHLERGIRQEESPKAVGPNAMVMLQGFNWDSSKHSTSWYDVLLSVCKELAVAGVTTVWFPPPSNSVSAEGYLPRRLYDLDSKYGTKEKLKQVIQAFRKQGIGCIADIVINHRCGETQDQSGSWCIFEGGAGDGRLDWGPWNIVKDDETCTDSSGQPDTGWNYEHAPDVDHLNTTVQAELIEWLNWLKNDIGFDGWRFDFAKGYAGGIAGNYVEKTSPNIAVGEIWNDMSYDGNGKLSYNQDNHRQGIVDWIDATGGRAAAFDFTTKGILQQAVKDELWRLRDSTSKPPGVLGWWRERAVTFIDNHDTGSSQGLWPFPSDKVMQGYVYILTHPGIPCIFYDHFFDWGIKDEIVQLLKIRKLNGIRSDSMWNILAAENDMYVAEIDGQVRMKIGARLDIGSLAPSLDEYDIVIHGEGYVVWQKKGKMVR